MIHATPKDVERFFRYVDKLPNGCWFWTGARSRGKGNRKWYGSFRVGRRTVRSHAFSCEVVGEKGPLPEGHDRDHKCVFSLCVNPDHIEYVPKKVNQDRKVSRRKGKSDEASSYRQRPVALVLTPVVRSARGIESQWALLGPVH